VDGSKRLVSRERLQPATAPRALPFDCRHATVWRPAAKPAGESISGDTSPPRPDDWPSTNMKMSKCGAHCLVELVAGLGIRSRRLWLRVQPCSARTERRSRQRRLGLRIEPAFAGPTPGLVGEARPYLRAARCQGPSLHRADHLPYHACRRRPHRAGIAQRLAHTNKAAGTIERQRRSQVASACAQAHAHRLTRCSHRRCKETSRKKYRNRQPATSCHSDVLPAKFAANRSRRFGGYDLKQVQH